MLLHSPHKVAAVIVPAMGLPGGHIDRPIQALLPESAKVLEYDAQRCLLVISPFVQRSILNIAWKRASHSLPCATSPARRPQGRSAWCAPTSPASPASPAAYRPSCCTCRGAAFLTYTHCNRRPSIRGHLRCSGSCRLAKSAQACLSTGWTLSSRHLACRSAHRTAGRRHQRNGCHRLDGARRRPSAGRGVGPCRLRRDTLPQTTAGRPIPALPAKSDFMVSMSGAHAAVTTLCVAR